MKRLLGCLLLVGCGAATQLSGAFAESGGNPTSSRKADQQLDQAIRRKDQGPVPSALLAPEGEPKAVSKEGIEYLKKLRKGTPFGSTDFNLQALRAGMGARNEPRAEGVRLIRLKIGELRCEWVLARGADPDLRLLYLHGGGWVSGSGGNYLPLAPAQPRLRSSPGIRRAAI